MPLFWEKEESPRKSISTRFEECKGRFDNYVGTNPCSEIMLPTKSTVALWMDIDNMFNDDTWLKSNFRNPRI